MAQQPEASEAAAPRAGGKRAWIVVVIIALFSAGAGFAVPQFLGSASEASDSAEATHGSKKGNKDGESGIACVPFGDVVANLDDNRMMRYVRAKFSLAVEKRESQSVQHVIEENKTILKNWLIGYLQNKQIEEVRGTEGFNRVRREIQEQFNQMLFAEGDERIKEILFEEFNVQ